MRQFIIERSEDDVMTPRNQAQNVRYWDRAALGLSVRIMSGQPLWLPLIGTGTETIGAGTEACPYVVPR
ncbi:hypothetical protein [Desulfosoma caldarium]|nr:hypothetical protein [Desulfosoma caldarium]